MHLKVALVVLAVVDNKEVLVLQVEQEIHLQSVLLKEIQVVIQQLVLMQKLVVVAVERQVQELMDLLEVQQVQVDQVVMFPIHFLVQHHPHMVKTIVR